MGLTESLGRIYEGLESRFFGFMDFLEEKGIPVYGLINPLEERGIPVFPLLLSVLVVGGFALAAFTVVGAPKTEFTLSAQDNLGNPLTYVELRAYGKDNAPLNLGKTRFGDGDKIPIEGIGPGAYIRFEARKEGYFFDETTPEAVFVIDPVSAGQESVDVLLHKTVRVIAGKVLVVDALTQDPVSGAKVVFSQADRRTDSCTESAKKGEFDCAGILEGEELQLEVTANDHYEKTVSRVVFSEGTAQKVELQSRAGLAPGSSTRVILKPVNAKTRQPLKEVSVRIVNASSGQTLFEDPASTQEEIVTNIQKQVSIRILATKPGFIGYDSGSLQENITLVEDQQVIEVPLTEGGTQATVFVQGKTTQTPRTGALLQLYNSFLEKIDEKKTDLSGSVQFDSLNPQETYYVTAFEPGFLPARMPFSPAQTSLVTLELEKAGPENAVFLEVTVVDSASAPANSALLTVFEQDANESLLPAGYETLTTGVTGKATLSMRPGQTFTVSARKGIEEGEETIALTGSQNQVVIYLQRMEGFKEIKVSDLFGKELREGTLQVSTPSGDVLFDGSVSGEPVYVDTTGTDYLNAHYTSADGQSFTEELPITSAPALFLKVAQGDASNLTPKIVFDGLFNAEGKKASGLRGGETGYLKYTVTFPEGNLKSAFHLRTGPGESRYVDSQDISVVGFSAAGAKAFWGRTYAPGFSSIDFANAGEPNEDNKFLELYFSRGGTHAIKVRVKAKENAAASEFEIHYRALTQVGNRTYRQPFDPVLKEAENSAELQGLYAQTLSSTHKIFSGTSQCQNDLCASFRIVSENGDTALPNEFTAAAGKKYALEIELNPLTDTSAKITLTTSKQAPVLTFTGTQKGAALGFPDSDKTVTEQEIRELVAPANRSTQASVYFKTLLEGTGTLNVLISDSRNALTQ
ncbi:MAG: hypothetical protein HY917_01705, partial [Candidatus Diapherotrites archaeon]|nr:hypothetical protein [Candidatus Diapherotrites archaeon]